MNRHHTIFLLVLCALMLDSASARHPQVGCVDHRAQDRTGLLLHAIYDPTDPRVFVVAHRGDWRNAPENSLPAIQRVIDAEIEFVELDIRKTSDGHLILMHDETLDRTTTGSGRVDEHTLAQIKRLRLLNGYGVPTECAVPTLEEALRTTAGKILVYLDKSYPHLREAHALAESLGITQEVFFYGHVPFEQLKADYPDLADTVPYLPKLNPDTPNIDRYVAGYLERKRSPAFVVSFERDDPAFLRRLAGIQAQGKRLWASPLWPGMCGDRTDDRAVADPDANWGWLVRQGFSMICTDRPHELTEYLDR